jgi:hypothetical protein
LIEEDVKRPLFFKAHVNAERGKRIFAATARIKAQRMHPKAIQIFLYGQEHIMIKLSEEKTA